MTEENEQNTGENVEAAAPQAEQPQMVPVDALQAERKERQQLQEELKTLRDHVSLMANRTQEKPKDQFEGAQDDDILTVGEAKKYISNLDNSYRASIEEIRFSQSHKDYDEVVQKYLPDVLKKKPRLKDTLQKTQDFELAYELAKNSDAYRKDQFEKDPHPDAKRIMDNSNKTGNLSQMGSTSPTNSVRSYKQMSDADFQKEVQRNLGYV